MTRRSPAVVRLPPYGVYVWESRHDREFRMDVERHDFFELFYILDGAGQVVVGEATAPCREGDLIVVPPRADHRFVDRVAPVTLFGVALAPGLAGHDPAAWAALPAGRVPLPARRGDQVRDTLRQILFEQVNARPGSGLRIVGLTLELVANLVQTRPAERVPVRESVESNLAAVERYRDGLADRFFEPISVDRAADDLGLSRRSFTRLFRRAAGCSFAKYVERLRIDYACRLLRGRPQSVLAVAFECGYEDLSSFYRAFRRQRGGPPDKWRRATEDKKTADPPIGPKRQDSPRSRPIIGVRS
jgi:AraC family L-rhamnose operon regulatory protein RhaS